MQIRVVHSFFQTGKKWGGGRSTAVLGNRAGWGKECAPSGPVSTSSKLHFSSTSELVGIPHLPSYYCWTSLVSCELREEELLVILRVVTPTLVGLGLLCSSASHLTLVLPHSYLSPTTLHGRPPALRTGLLSGLCRLNLAILEGLNAGWMDGGSKWWKISKYEQIACV